MYRYIGSSRIRGLDQTTILKSCVKWLFTDECVAAVPMIFLGTAVSPVYSNHYINRTAHAVEVDGTTAERIMAINSGVAWSVKFLKRLAGLILLFL